MPATLARLLVGGLAALALACSPSSPADPPLAADAATAPRDGGATADAASAADAAASAPTMQACLDAMFPGGGTAELDYDQFAPTIGAHCAGTDHQHIAGVERVVFVGDSITVGSPPTPAGQVYRARLAERLAVRFGLEPPSALWETYNALTGEALLATSGDFASCARWGARADDLIEDDSQLADCMPEGERGKRHLVILTVGGNDIAAITQDGADGVSVEQSWAETEAFVARVRAAIEWIRAPGRFPAGVDVVFTNLYEYTDATGDTASCAAAAAAGFEPWPDPQPLREMVIWANEQLVRIATETGTDVVFLLEQFCGHGFHRDDPASPCYRGPGAARWFDDTCIHPNPAGHAALADLFEQVIAE